MTAPTLALDVGTTSIRALVIDPSGIALARARRNAPLATPSPGRVEQDAEKLVAYARSAMESALADARLTCADIGALGITAQRSNIVLWDAASGKPVAPMVSWQDLRGQVRAAELFALGFPVTHQTAASKLEAVLNGIPQSRQRLNAGALLWGNIDTYVAWCLSRGDVYVMDESQACTTGYLNPFVGGWNGALIELQGIDPARFPVLVDTFAAHGLWQATTEVSIGALIADQQAAALAQGCTATGVGKVSFGTSATCDVATGAQPMLGAGAYPLVLWRNKDDRQFCLEGMVNTAGALFDWIVALLGLPDVDALNELAASIDDCGGVRVLPALQGLGTPHGDATQRARITGLSRASGRAHVARAAFEAIAFRVREIDDALYAMPGLPRPASLRVDGGGSASDLLLQLQADAIGRPVERLAVREATACGAALGAGIGLGQRTLDSVAKTRRTDRIFEPRISADERETRFAAWRAGVRS